MKIEMSESLVASWLKHVKHCIVVNTNWKASPYWTPAVPDAEITRICEAAAVYFNERGIRILDCPNESVNVDDENAGENDNYSPADWQNMLLQTECDAVGLAHSSNKAGALVYAVESAFHRNKVQYSKRKSAWRPLHLSGATVTAWNIALKMFKNALSMYRWYGVRDAHVVFVVPMSSVPVETEILGVCRHVSEFYQQADFHFDFEYYFEHATPGAAGSFSESIKTPVNLAATVVDDTSELYLRGHILDAGTQSIDVLMLDSARRILNCENLDEMAGMYLGTPESLLAAIEQIRVSVITVTEAENHQMYMRQRSRFDRCHGALRAYYAAFHEMTDVPTIPDLHHAGQDPHGGAGGVHEADNLHAQPGVDVILDPADVDEFKQQLLQTHRARRTRVYADGHTFEDVWRADRFTENSNLMGNIKSSTVYVKAAQNNVIRIEFSIIHPE